MIDEKTHTDALIRAFTEQHGSAPDGVWAAPGRVNLIGEHTDYNDGFCLPFALDRATLAAVRRRDDDRVTVSSTSKYEPVETTLDAVRPGSVTGWAAYPLGVVWALREAGHVVPGLDIMVDSTVPTGAGLSSSAALSCSVALAVNDIAALGVSRKELAAAARRAENEVAGAPTGPMDQLASLLGARDAAVLIDCRSIDVQTTPLGLESAGLTLLVIDTKAEHELVDGAYGERRASCENAARLLGVVALRDATPEDIAAAGDTLDEVTLRRARHVVTEDQRVLDVAAMLRDGRVAEIGPLLDASHVSMRDDFEISCQELDAAVEAAQGAGALGARMTGGGFGGSAIALVTAGTEAAIESAVMQRFAADGLRSPEVFAVQPDEGAHRVR